MTSENDQFLPSEFTIFINSIRTQCFTVVGDLMNINNIYVYNQNAYISFILFLLLIYNICI